MLNIITDNVKLKKKSFISAVLMFVTVIGFKVLSAPHECIYILYVGH